MSNTAGEIAKFFLNKSWVVFALSLIAGFFATILIPSEWRNSIPLENNDLRAIVSFVVAWAIYYVIFSGIRGLMKLATDKIKSNNLKKKNDEYRARQNREEIKDYLTTSPDKFYWLVEHLVEKGNPWTYIYAGSDYEDDYVMNTEWFLIEDAPEKKRVKRNDGKVHQEIYMGRYKIKLHDWLYEELKTIKSETKSLSHKHRTKWPIEWEIAENNNKEKAK